MRYLLQSFLLMLLCLVPLQFSFSAEEPTLRVAVISQVNPSRVTLNQEGSAFPADLSQGNDGIFRTDFAPPRIGEMGDSWEKSRYLLVAYWPDSKEQVYLGIKPSTPKQIDLTLYHFTYSDNQADAEEIDKIDSLGRDYISLLEKYFRSRAYHRFWRNVQRQPYHMVALRSARLWYDSAISLSLLTDSPFRMDKEVSDIVEEYEGKARQDKNFDRRWRRYTRKGYIAEMNQQVIGSDFQFIAQIPSLIASGRIGEAEALNDEALQMLKSASNDTRRIVERVQGVNKRLLIENRSYILTLK
jgi:hypothetical protein